MTSWTISKDKITDVGVIGAGTMGSCMVKKLIEYNYRVFVHDISKEAQDCAQTDGAKVLDSSKAVAQSADIVLLSLPMPSDVRDVVLSKNGLFEGARKGQVFIDLSTVEPDTSRPLYKELQKHGISYIDAPVLGRPARVGKWLLPVGGDEEAVEYVMPVLKTFAGDVVYTGGSGAGNAVKLCNQMMFAAINAISAEIMATAKNVGIDQKVLYETISKSGAATVSALFCDVGRMIVTNGYDDPIFKLELLNKDASLGIKMAKQNNCATPVASSIQVFYDIAMAKGLGKEDTSAVYKVIEKMTK